MSGPQHFLEAERLITFWESGEPSGDGDAAEVLAAAQVHATLALAAATALNSDLPTPDWKAWYDAAATKPEEATR